MLSCVQDNEPVAITLIGIGRVVVNLVPCEQRTLASVAVGNPYAGVVDGGDHPVVVDRRELRAVSAIDALGDGPKADMAPDILLHAALKALS